MGIPGRVHVRFYVNSPEQELIEVTTLDADGNVIAVAQESTMVESLRTISVSMNQDSGGRISLVCAICAAHLRRDAGQLDKGDVVYSLKCGHLVDKRCLDAISKPQSAPRSGRDRHLRAGVPGCDSTHNEIQDMTVERGYSLSDMPTASSLVLPQHQTRS